MLNLKTSLPYLFGLISLAVSLAIVSQETGVEVKPLPLIPFPATSLPHTRIVPEASNKVRCQTLSQPRYFFYISPITDEAQPYLTITGTIYASDLTPLSDAIVKVWQTDPEQMQNPFSSPIRLYIPTDEAGYYQFTALKPARSEQPYLHLQFVYKDHCPLSLYLHVITESQPKLAEQPAFAKVVEVSGPVLQGPLDIVLPVSSTSR